MGSAYLAPGFALLQARSWAGSLFTYIALPIDGGGMLMATDALESMGQKLNVGNNFYISLSPPTREDADRIFNGLSDGGKVEMPMSDMFWGYFGSFSDKFGVQWMLNVGNGQPV